MFDFAHFVDYPSTHPKTPINTWENQHVSFLELVWNWDYDFLKLAPHSINSRYIRTAKGYN